LYGRLKRSLRPNSHWPYGQSAPDQVRWKKQVDYTFAEIELLIIIINNKMLITFLQLKRRKNNIVCKQYLISFKFCFPNKIPSKNTCQVIKIYSLSPWPFIETSVWSHLYIFFDFGKIFRRFFFLFSVKYLSVLIFFNHLFFIIVSKPFWGQVC
jgi:hypothetical protein